MLNVSNFQHAVSQWKDFRTTSLQQFRRSQGEATRDVIIFLDPKTAFAHHLVTTCYRKAKIDPDEVDVPAEASLEMMELIDAPYVLILPLATALAGLHRMKSTCEALLKPPPLGEVRIVLVRETEKGVQSSVITDKVLRPKKSFTN